MIEMIPAADHVAAFRIVGTLDAQDYDEIIPAVEEKLRGHERIGIFVDLEGLEDITGDAIQRDIKYGIDKLGELHRFGRAAVTTERRWIETATRLVDTLFPKVEARVFDFGEKEAALEWVSRIDEPA